MKTLRIAAAALLLCALPSSAALAQSGARSMRQVSPVSRTGLEYDAGGYAMAADQAPAGAAQTSPSDQPTTPPTPAKEEAAPAAKQEAAPAASEQAASEEPKEEEHHLFSFPALEARGISLRGWLDQGFTWNPASPADRFNGPVGYNDRSNDYMLNQLYFIAEREVKPQDCCWDFGGRVDLLYGEDRRFPVAFGLDDDWNDGRRFYGLVMPQLYGDVARGDWTFRAGHFLAPVGYESVMAPDNFFYSHTYSFLYAQPTTFTGGMLKYKLNDRLSVNGGIDTGWNNWELRNDKLGYFTGVNWTSCDQKSTVAFEITIGNEQPEPIDSTRTLYTLVFTRKITDKLLFAMEHDLGVDTNAVTPAGQTHAEWYSFVSYFLYELNDCWSVGCRYEWLADDDGAIVASLPEPQGPGILPVPAHWNDLSFGANYKPNKNLLVRSELRYDWVGTLVPTTDHPFDDFTKGAQFLWGTDVIVKF